MQQFFPRLFRKPSPLKIREDEGILGYALHANGRVDAIKQGSGIYGSGFGASGFGDGAFSETAFGTQVALTQSGFGWAAAYSVSTWVYRCIEARTSAIHRMPWAVINKRTKQPMPRHPLTLAFKRNKQKLFKKIEQSQLLYGESFFEFVTNDYGYVSDLFWLNNLGIAVLVGAGTIQGYAYTAMQGGHADSFGVHDVAFMKTFNPFNDLRGMSPTEVIMDEIGIDKDVARIVRTYYSNDTRVGILLIPKNNLTEADSQRFLDEWKRNNQGPNRAGKPQLMPYDMTVERVQEPATLDDVQLRESTRREIAAAYGVPLSLAGAWDEARYQSLPEQRKSFYEETIIPECDNIAEFVNSDIMPVMDDSGRAEFKYDYMSILALTEDAQKKNDIYSNRLVSGLITRAEAREALGHPSTPADKVYYIPNGATVVPAGELALVTPTANTVDETASQQNTAPTQAQEQKPQQNTPQSSPESTVEPKPGKDSTPEMSGPGQLFNKQELQARGRQVLDSEPSAKTILPPQATALDELAAWEKKAINSNAIKASQFVCYVIDKPIQDVIREALRQAGRSASKTTMRSIFAGARKAMQPPEVAIDYWRHYDALMAELGSAWLTDYMTRAFQHLEPHIAGIVSPDMVQTALDTYHPDFMESWLGTEADPGPLVKLVQAGMGAAQEALTHHGQANPQRPVGKAITVLIDWDLLAQEARSFAQTYLYSLIKNLDDTTRKFVQETIAKWVDSGKPLDDLKAQLRQVFTDPVRASNIAETESTRVYAEGAKQRYQKAGVQKVKLSRINDSLVCDVCQPLEGTVVPLNEGWKSATGEAWPPFHPRCRHWLIPVFGGE